MLDHQRLEKMDARVLKDLIQDVLHHLEFNAAEADNNMLERLARKMASIQPSQITVLSGKGTRAWRFWSRITASESAALAGYAQSLSNESIINN